MRSSGMDATIPLSIVIIILYVLSSFAINSYKRRYSHAPWIHESSIAALLGVIVGGLLKLLDGAAVRFDSNLFFYLVLPPVIFSAGYTLKRRKFFRYFHLISLFGIFGTLANFVFISLAAYYFDKLIVYCGVFDDDALVGISWGDSMLLAAVLSANDEVSAMSLVRMRDYPRLGALIFGEGVINDVLSIVLFKSLLDFSDNKIQPINSPDGADSINNNFGTIGNFIADASLQVGYSCIIGLASGLMNAKILRSLPSLRSHPVHQTALVLLFGYLSYFIAESVHVSGILTLFVAAITLAHYSWHNLSKTSQLATKISFQSLSDIAEAFAFCYVGLSLWAYTSDNYSYIFSFYMLLVIVFSRLITIFALCKICTVLGAEIMPLNEQIAFAAGGLVRGCLCWAQVLQITGRGSELLVTSTLIIVMITTVSSGFLLPIIIPRLVSHLNNAAAFSPLPQQYYAAANITRNIFDDPTMKLSVNMSETNIGNNTLVDAGADRKQIGRVYAVIYLLWIKFDETIMKPLFGGSDPDETRSYLMDETKNMSILSIISQSVQTRQIVRHGVDISDYRTTPMKDRQAMTPPLSLPSGFYSGTPSMHQVGGDYGSIVDVINDIDDDIFMKDELSIIGLSSPIDIRQPLSPNENTHLVNRK